MEIEDDIQNTEKIICAYCPHVGSEHFQSATLIETNEQNSSKTGLCKVVGCECIQFKPLDV